MEREKQERHKETERLTGRFGTNLLGEGASEEELLAYATLLSEEAFSSEEGKRTVHGTGSSFAQSEPAGRHGKGTPVDPSDSDLEEAIRLSLLESEHASSSPSVNDFDLPIRYAKSSKHGTQSHGGKASGSKGVVSASEEDDLEFALQLSLAEEESRRAVEDDFPMLEKSPSPGSEGSGKGKGKSKRR
jgi:hypothetical protein